MKKSTELIIGVLSVVVIVCICLVSVIFLKPGKEDKILEQMDLGQKYLDQLEYDKALASYQAVLEIDPNYVEAYLGIVDVYMQQEKFDEALKYANEGYELTGDSRLEEKVQLLEDIIADLVPQENDGDDTVSENETVEEEVEEVPEETEQMQTVARTEREDYDGYYVINEYDSLDRLIKSTEYYSDGTTYTVEILYQDNKVYYNYNNYASDLLELDENSRIVKQTFTLNYDGKVIWNDRVYDNEGNCEINFYNSKGELIWNTTVSEEKGSQDVYTSVTNWE